MRSRCRSSSCLCRSRFARSTPFRFAASTAAPEALSSVTDCCSSTDLLSHPRAMLLWYDKQWNSPSISCGGIMKVWQIQSFGIDQLALTDLPQPRPGRAEVLVKVHAASLNYRDLRMVLGQ